MKYRLFALVLAFCLMLLSSCIPFDPVFRYEGERTDLAATAIYSIPGTESSPYDVMLALETDQYGRTLYACYLSSSLACWEDCGASKGVLAVLVMQKSDEDKVYFYGERNYLFTFVPTDEGKGLTAELVSQYFSENELLSLKESNRWDQEMMENDELLSSAPLQLEKGDTLSKTAEKAIMAKVGSNIRYDLLRSDGENRSLYYIVSLIYHEDTNSREPTYYIVMLDSTGNVMDDGNAIRKLDGFENIADVIREFQEAYGWINC